jgi:hypothetical protein
MNSFLQAYKVNKTFTQLKIMLFNVRDMRKCSEDTPEMRKERLKSDSGISNLCSGNGYKLEMFLK